MFELHKNNSITPLKTRCALPAMTQEGLDMKPHVWAIALLAVVLTLAGCSSNYKFNDDEFRPLGDPQANDRGN